MPIKTSGGVSVFSETDPFAGQCDHCGLDVARPRSGLCEPCYRYRNLHSRLPAQALLDARTRKIRGETGRGSIIEVPYDPFVMQERW